MRTRSPRRSPFRLQALLAAALLFGAVACSDDNTDTDLQEAEEAGEAQALVGETITVSGEVEGIVSDELFLIGAEYLSLSAGEGTPIFHSGDTEIVEGGLVQVTGTVDEIILTDVATQLGFADDYWADGEGADELVIEYEEEFGVVADAVEFVPDEGQTALEDAEQAESAEDLVGQTVTVAGVVEETLPPQAFRISGDEALEGTLVLDADETEVAEEGTAQVTGTVVEFVLADIEEEFGFDFDDDLFVDITDEYVIVADMVEYVPVD